MHRAFVASALFVLAAVTASAQDPVKLAPKLGKVVFENDYVRVLRWTESLGDKVPMHEHPAMVSIALSAGKSRYTLADGTTKEVESTPGQATWSNPQKHASENLSSGGDLIQVEMKAKPPAAMTAVAASEDAVAVDPKHYTVVLQNERVRVLRIHYAPGEKSMMHAHPANVAVFLTTGQTKFTLPDGTSMAREVKPGQVEWSDRQNHQPENAGTKPFELILVELR